MDTYELMTSNVPSVTISPVARWDTTNAAETTGYSAGCHLSIDGLRFTLVLMMKTPIGGYRHVLHELK